jgi:hypothetical protein
VGETIRADFARLIRLAYEKLEQVNISQEIEQTRAILKIDGQHSPYRIVMKETITSSARRYSYYILVDNRVMIGLDNHADRHALRLKYGDNFTDHLTELIPHQHGVDKRTVNLTKIWTGEQFLDKLDDLIAKIEI